MNNMSPIDVLEKNGKLTIYYRSDVYAQLKSEAKKAKKNLNQFVIDELAHQLHRMIKHYEGKVTT